MSSLDLQTAVIHYLENSLAITLLDFDEAIDLKNVLPFIAIIIIFRDVQ